MAEVVGLTEVGADELVGFESGAIGMALDLEPGRAGVVLLAGAGSVRSGEGAEALGSPPELVVGPELLGRAIDPLGRPLDNLPEVRGTRVPVFAPAPPLDTRAPVTRPLMTGLMVVDAAIPIGRGQRQLIVGDRNIGKTALALDIVAAQRPGDVACVYVMTGQPVSRMLGVREALHRAGALGNTVLVVADGAQAPGLQYLAPYAGAAAAEYFRDRGQDAIVVYDDLTKHADVYRELALLLGRSPGREAFPGDIFHIHAELLERATALDERRGGGSVTAFPIVETTDSDISAYIPTNLISITDGQLYLDPGRFERNLRPAVDIGRSVSRVGGAAQTAVMRTSAASLRILMARFEALESLARLGLDIDPATAKAIERGRLMRDLLRQPRFTVRTAAAQIVAVTALTEGWLDGMSPRDATAAVWGGGGAGGGWAAGGRDGRTAGGRGGRTAGERGDAGGGRAAGGSGRRAAGERGGAGGGQAAGERAALGPGPTLCVGHRAAGMLARRGVRADIVYAAPMGVGGITEMMLRLAEDLLGEYVRGRLSSFDIVSSTFNGVGDDPPTTRRLLPVDTAPSAGDPPARYVSPDDLQAAAVRELLYITLYDMLIDALVRAQRPAGGDAGGGAVVGRAGDAGGPPAGLHPSGEPDAGGVGDRGRRPCPSPRLPLIDPTAPPSDPLPPPSDPLPPPSDPLPPPSDPLPPPSDPTAPSPR